ncbi:MAG: hypothetical protein H6812_10185 [Phycisphaeraceae bacterium]|nr:hypothetical protein [Phycisphaerales bacterium]MCB9843614.1 hypothetical protein [Phycisphaeraceae bacterium]
MSTRITASALAAGLALAASAAGQYAITKSTIDGGGTTLTGATYTLTGTIGQADAGVLTGANSTLYGGFWGAIAPSPPSCFGDVDNSGAVDVDDLNAILSVFGTTVGIGDFRDVANNDGFVDVDDLNVVLANFGATCP